MQRLSALIGPGRITVIRTSSHWSGSCETNKPNEHYSHISHTIWVQQVAGAESILLPEVHSGWGCCTPSSGGCCPQWTPGKPPLGHWPDRYLSKWGCGPEGGASGPPSPPKKNYMKIRHVIKRRLQAYLLFYVLGEKELTKINHQKLNNSLKNYRCCETVIWLVCIRVDKIITT